MNFKKGWQSIQNGFFQKDTFTKGLLFYGTIYHINKLNNNVAFFTSAGSQLYKAGAATENVFKVLTEGNAISDCDLSLPSRKKLSFKYGLPGNETL